MGGASKKRRGKKAAGRGEDKAAAVAVAVDVEEVQAPEVSSGLPMANVVRLMRQVLPPNVKIASAAKKLTHDCAVEFVGFVSGEAAERARTEHRRTMAPEDFTLSFQSLGLDSYVQPMTTYLHGYRAFENAGGRTTCGGGVVAARPAAAPAPAASVPLHVASPGEPAFTEEELRFLRSVIPPLPNEYDGPANSSVQAPPSSAHGGGYRGRK